MKFEYTKHITKKKYQLSTRHSLREMIGRFVTFVIIKMSFFGSRLINHAMHMPMVNNYLYAFNVLKAAHYPSVGSEHLEAVMTQKITEVGRKARPLAMIPRMAFS